MNGREETTKDKVLILLAPEFDEAETVYCLEQLRKASLCVNLVGMASGLVKGKHGLFIRPDFSLDQLLPEQPIRLILVPGGQTCSASIMSDPRVHRLLKATLHSRNYVAALSGAERMMNKAGFSNAATNGLFVGQGQQNMNEFASNLVDLVADPQPI